eukprot:scaffold445360_cov39-Prasinocladus_malaysianus.AAC.1
MQQCHDIMAKAKSKGVRLLLPIDVLVGDSLEVMSTIPHNWQSCCATELLEPTLLNTGNPSCKP